VPAPGTPGTLEGRANRGADGTNPRTDSPIIPGGTTNITGSSNDWRRGRAVDGNAHRGDASQTPAVDATHHDTPASGEVTPSPAPRPDDWRGRAVGHHQDVSPAPAPSGGSNSRDVPRRIIDAIGGAHISRGETPANDSKPREHSSGSGNSSGRGNDHSSPPPKSSPPPSHEHSSPPPSSSHDSGSHESHNDHENKKN
jgi:hypothetical protein